MTPINRGLRLGVANMAVIALGITMWPHYRPDGVLLHQRGAGLFLTLVIAGLFAAVPVGIGLGALAESIAAWPIWMRRMALGVPAVVIVALCGAAARFEAFSTLACVPTLAAVLLLERSTRAAEPLPVAQRIATLPAAEQVTSLRRRASGSSGAASGQ